MDTAILTPTAFLHRGAEHRIEDRASDAAGEDRVQRDWPAHDHGYEGGCECSSERGHCALHRYAA